MNIDGFSEKTAALLFDKFAVKRFSDLYSLDYASVRSLDGFKDAKTDNIFSAIEKSKNVPLANFIYSLGISNVGKKTAKDLAEKFKSIDNLASADRQALLKIPDIGEIMADGIVSCFNDEENLSEINRLFSLGVKPFFDQAKKSGVFSGEKVVLTGTLSGYKREEAAKLIEERGGEISSSVSKSVTLVLAGESAGSKLEKAKALGIKIIDEERFNELINA